VNKPDVVIPEVVPFVPIQPEVYPVKIDEVTDPKPTIQNEIPDSSPQPTIIPYEPYLIPVNE
jgi:hypothetical protein